MYSQMVKKVMPLPEEFATLFVIAGEHTRQAAS
jgi:hypothetical protein